MALEYEDIDLGKISEVTAEDLNLVKKEINSAKEEFDSTINEIQEEQEEQNTRIDALYSTVENMYTYVETEQAYTTRETANGAKIFDEQNTPVLEIKGSTVRNKNLIPYPYKNKDGTSPGTFEGVTLKDDNGVITANGTAGTNGSWIMISPLIKVKPNTSYFLSGCPSGGSKAGFYMHFNGRNENGEETYFDKNDTGDGVLFTTPSATTRCYIYIVVYNNKTITDKVFKPLLVEGKTGMWTPPFTDLKHAYINSLQSTNADGTEEDIYTLPETLELGEFDTFNPQTGELIKKTKRIELNGGETGWVTVSAEQTGNTKMFALPLSDLATADNDGINVVSVTYKGTSNTKIWRGADGIAVSGEYLRIRDNSFTLSDFKTHLAKNPLILEYKLATPTITTIENAPKKYKAWNHGSETVIQGETDNSQYGAMPTIKNAYFAAIGAKEE